MNPSKTVLEKTAQRLESLKAQLPTSIADLGAIDDAVSTLRSAEDALTETVMFLDDVQRPLGLRFEWCFGIEPFDLVHAVGLLRRKAMAIENLIAEEFFPTAATDAAEARPVQEAAKVHRYIVGTGPAEVTIESPTPLSVDDVCQEALRALAPLGVPLGVIMQVIALDSGDDDDPVIVSTEHQLRKAGLLKGRRGV